jgi:hypothetical protein
MKTTKPREPQRAHSVSWQPLQMRLRALLHRSLRPGGRAFAQAWFALEDLRRVADAMYAVAAEQKAVLRVMQH